MKKMVNFQLYKIFSGFILCYIGAVLPNSTENYFNLFLPSFFWQIFFLITGSNQLLSFIKNNNNYDIAINILASFLYILCIENIFFYSSTFPINIFILSILGGLHLCMLEVSIQRSARCGFEN